MRTYKITITSKWINDEVKKTNPTEPVTFKQLGFLVYEKLPRPVLKLAFENALEVRLGILATHLMESARKDRRHKGVDLKLVVDGRDVEIYTKSGQKF